MGGNVNSITDIVEAKYFRPNYHKRNVIALRFLGAFTTGFSGKVVAPYSRFYLGGETDLRGFDIRTVSPVVFIPTQTTTSFVIPNSTRLNASGAPSQTAISIPTLSYQISFPGGDTQGVANLEYRIPIAPHVSASLFGDIGATGALRRDQLQLNSTDLTALQAFPKSGTFNGVSATLPFQPGTNFKLRSTVGVELVVQLPIVQAPFRIYWGYNLNRMSQVITSPQTRFPADPNLANPINPPCDKTRGIISNCYDTTWDTFLNGLSREDFYSQAILGGSTPANGLINLFNNPQKTNFFDPIRTFRFTVSRTF
jgi:outer membrane protein insertion porin family